MQDDQSLLRRFARLCIAGSLIGCRLEMAVALSAAASLQQHHDLSVFGHIADVFAGFCIIDNGSTGHFDSTVFSVLAGTPFGTAAFTIGGHDVAFILQVEQCPVVAVSPQIDMASSASVASVGSPFRNVLFAAEVRRTSAALSRAAVDLHIIYKV